MAAALRDTHRFIRWYDNRFVTLRERFCSRSVWVCDLAWLMLLRLESPAKLIKRLAASKKFGSRRLMHDRKRHRVSSFDSQCCESMSSQKGGR